MKKIFLLTVIFFMGILYVQTVQASENDSIVQQKKLRLANKLLTSGGQERAYQLFLECANEGNAQAMNALGVLLQRGWGIEKNEEQAVRWFLRASEAGYTNADVNLAQIYAKGLGTEQNYEKAVFYTEKTRDIHPRWANYNLGYYHYKGLGVEQNYEKAVEFFDTAGEAGSANAHYFLGLSYRNGYGVERKEGEAQYYLQKAAEMGHRYSKEELSKETAETQPVAVRLPGAIENKNNRQNIYRKINRQNIAGGIAGEYQGSIITYDYSGNQIVREVELKLTISNPDLAGKVTGEWTEADSIKADFEAFVTDSSLRFENTLYARTDYYNRRQAVKWNFTQATLERTENNGEVFLAGNIQMFSPRTKEPEKPMYISLKQTKSNSMGNGGNKFTAYYIPNSNDVKISFTNEEPQNNKNLQNTILRIYTLNGQFIYEENLGNLSDTQHSYIVNLPVSQGHYLMHLQQGEITHTTLLIKK